MTPDTRPLREQAPSSVAPAAAPGAEPAFEASPVTDLMILPDGTIYARNLTPDLAGILAGLAPHDTAMAKRASMPRTDP